MSAAADLMTILEHCSELEGLKVAWVGDGNNVLHDLMLACAMLGIDIHYAIPEGYEPAEDVVERSNGLADKNGSKVMMTNDPVEAVAEQMLSTQMCLFQWVRTYERQNQIFDGFQVNETLVSNMNDEWKFMHCLPAHRGDEVTDWVMDHDHSIVFDKRKSNVGSNVITCLLG